MCLFSAQDAHPRAEETAFLNIGPSENSILDAEPEKALMFKRDFLAPEPIVPPEQRWGIRTQRCQHVVN